MGGLAGHISTGGTLEPGWEQLLQALPKGDGQTRSVFTEEGITLLHSGDAVAGTGKGGRPLSRRFGCHTLTAVLDGQLYNAEALRETLRQRGHVMYTLCDVELVLLSYIEWGTAAPEHFSGVFSLAVWDGRALYLARDRMGVKPLFLHRSAGGLAFATDPVVLLAHPAIPRRLPIKGAARLLHSCGQRRYGPEVLEGIECLEPGHWLVWQDGVRRTGAYWKPQVPEELLPPEKSAELFAELLTESVWLRAQTSVMALVPGDGDGLSEWMTGLWPCLAPKRCVLRIWDRGAAEPPAEDECMITGERAALGLTDIVTASGRPDFTVGEAVGALLCRQVRKRGRTVLSAAGGYTLLTGRSEGSVPIPPDILSAEVCRVLCKEGETAPPAVLAAFRPLPERIERLGVYAGLEIRLPFAAPELIDLRLRMPQQAGTLLCSGLPSPGGGCWPMPDGPGWRHGLETRYRALLSRPEAAIWQLCRRETVPSGKGAAVVMAQLIMLSHWLEYFNIRIT